MVDRIRRSWLIVPAHDDARLAEATQSGADVVVLDLQDTVHDSKKQEARERIRGAIPQLCEQGIEVFVRSDIELLYADLHASVWRGLSGVMLPGVTSVEQVREADCLIGKLQAERGVVKPPPVGEVLEADDPVSPEQALEIHLCLDTGRGNWDAVELIQASSRVKSISLGRADLTMDLREEPTGDLHLMPYLMQRLIIIANATGVQPIGAWWRGTSRGLVASYDDTLEAALTGRQAGFKGALCMRAHQVAALNKGFTPTDGETARAETVIAAFSGAQDNGKSSISLDGEFIDASRAAIAATLIDWTAACEAREQGRAAVTAQTEGASR
ncbi:MAG: aldolase/citrate lyase family protein [Candidatus Tectomicrobia bacterium]|nr:aldolase/citrate lyase family protein [Candidatus Tectomicrobia bacterium]